MTANGHSPREVIALCREREIRAVDLRFSDFRGQQRHFTIPVEELTESCFEEGFGFDGSSMRGWQAIHESDMVIVPESQTAFVDPFLHRTLAILCNVKDPVTHQSYPRDPRNIARKAEMYMLSTGIADQAAFGSDVEFFAFDSAQFDQNSNSGSYRLESGEGQWSRGTDPAGRQPYPVRHREGNLVMPPMDSLQNFRTELMLALVEGGVKVSSQQRATATGGQCRIELSPESLLNAGDHVVRLKYLAKCLSVQHGRTATFMPKPLWNDNGSGFHLRLSLSREDQPLFAGSGYGGLSETGLFAMGGILKHAPALLAFCCPTTNSYKRLIPGFEAPVNLSYSYRNRSAAIRIPVSSADDTGPRLEFRCPDPSSNPYLAMASVVMAMLDGIQNRIAPGKPLDKDLYDLAPEEQQDVPSTPSNLDQALQSLDRDREFLLRGDVFTPDVIDAWIQFKRDEEVRAIDERPHPYEFAMYFDC